MKSLKFSAAGILGQGLVGSLFTTVRVRREGYGPVDALRRQGQPVIFCLWHGGLLPLVYVHQYEGVVVLVSEHSDGEYITRVLHRYGYETARGSSTRGGTRGLRGLVRAAREGRDLAVTPDGPRGPAQVFKPGAVVAAQLTGLPLVPVGVGASSAWHFRSWDHFMVPRPLSRLQVVYGEPFAVDRGLPEAEVDAVAEEMGARLTAVHERAGRLARGEADEAGGRP